MNERKRNIDGRATGVRWSAALAEAVRAQHEICPLGAIAHAML